MRRAPFKHKNWKLRNSISRKGGDASGDKTSLGKQRSQKDRTQEVGAEPGYEGGIYKYCHRGGITKDKCHLELRLARVDKSNKKSFYH